MRTTRAAPRYALRNSHLQNPVIAMNDKLGKFVTDKPRLTVIVVLLVTALMRTISIASCLPAVPRVRHNVIRPLMAVVE